MLSAQQFAFIERNCIPLLILTTQETIDKNKDIARILALYKSVVVKNSLKI
jgi:hypothetical protein